MNGNREQELLEMIEINNQKIIQNAGNDSKVRAIEVENEALLAELKQIKIVKNEQYAAQQIRFEAAAEEAAFFMDNLVAEGFTMRELSAGEDHYQMLRIAVQNKLISLVEENGKIIIDIQAEDAEKQRQLRIELSQAKLETADAESKRDASVKALEEARAEITRLEGHVDDLRKEIAVGARNAYKVIDSEEQGKQMKELADRIKASRVHVFDVVPDNEINPKNFTAKRVDNGEIVSWNWTQSKNYVVVQDAAEVERFREQFASQDVIQDITLGHEAVEDVVQEDIFPEIPFAVAPEINVSGEVQVAVSAPSDGGQGQVTREEFEELKKAVDVLYVRQSAMENNLVA